MLFYGIFLLFVRSKNEVTLFRKRGKYSKAVLNEACLKNNGSKSEEIINIMLIFGM
jgi:hypothetical protein